MKLKGSLILITMIVIAIFALVMAITIPNLLTQRQINRPPRALNPDRMDPDSAAQTMLKSIVTAQATYTTLYRRYAPTLATLVNSGLLQKDGFAACTAPGTDSAIIKGYTYQMTSGRTWSSTSFFVRCKPASRGGGSCYSTDTSGRIVTTLVY